MSEQENMQLPDVVPEIPTMNPLGKGWISHPHGWLLLIAQLL
jgi:hypothetical protein